MIRDHSESQFDLIYIISNLINFKHYLDDDSAIAIRALYISILLDMRD